MNTPHQIQQTLKQLGFSNNEIKVLIFLFYTKKATVQHISLKTGIPFTSTQYCLSNLSSLEIIHTLPTQENIFEIVSRNEFCEWIEKTKQEQKYNYKKPKNEIFQFFSNIQNQSSISEAIHFKGKTEVIKIYEDILKSENDVYSWTDLSKIYKNLGNYTDEFIKKRIKKKIKTYAIKPKTKAAINDLKDKNRYREIKLINDFSLNGEIRVYGKKIAFINFDKNNPEGFLFEKESISTIFKSIFKNSWTIYS